MISAMKKVVVVTGGSSGIGLAICEYLHAQGYIVYGTSRHAENCTAVFNMVSMDVTNTESVQKAVQSILEKEGRIDVFINNAGIGMVGAIEDSIPEDSVKVFDTNVFGPLRTIQAVLPSMRAKRSGLIINIASIAGYMGLPYRGIYSATKASLRLMTEALRMELLPYHVKACVVDPGDYSTNISNSRQVNIPEHSPYKNSVQALEKMVNEEVKHSSNPNEVGILIHKIIQTPNPKVCYLSGKFLQKVSVFLKQTIGGKHFENILINHYRLKK